MLHEIPDQPSAERQPPGHPDGTAPTWQPLDLLELAQEAILVRDPHGGRIGSWNRAAEALYGWSRKDAVGTLAHRLLETQFPQPLAEIQAELLARGDWQGQLVQTTRDGRRLTVWSRWVLQRDERGQPSACAELATDLTDHGLAAIIASAHDAIYGKDLDGTITSWNASAERLYGYTQREAIGQPIELIVPPDRVPELAGLMRRLRLGERIQDWETVRHRKDGRLVDVSISISPLSDAAGRVVGASTITRDITERKLAQRRLRESEERFRTAFDQLAVGMAHLAPDGRWVRVNQRFCDMVGYTKTELLRLTFRDLTAPDDVATDVEQFERLLRGEIASYQREKRYVRKDGALVWANLNTTLVRGSTGEPTHFVSVIEDITERKRADAALRASERRLQRLIDSNIVGITISDVGGRIMDANDALLQLVGYTREDLRQGRLRWDDLTPPEYLPLDELAIEQARQSGAAQPWEKEYIRKDGTRVPVLIGFAVLDEAAGTLVAFILDLTARKQAENRQRALAEASRAFTATALQLPALFDTVAEYTAERLGGGCAVYVRSDAVDERLEAVSRCEPGAAQAWGATDLEPLVERVGATGESVLRARSADYPGSVAAAPLRLKGRVMGVVAVRRGAELPPYTRDDLVLLEDLADRAALSIDNARLHQRVEAAEGVRDDVLSAVSHDMKSPVAAINIEAQLLARRLERRGTRDTDWLVEGLRHIDAATSRMAGWIDELLDAAQLTAGQELTLSRKPTDLVELARLAMADHRRTAPRHQLRLTTAVEPLVGDCDAQRMRRVLDNLLSNAIKYSPSGCQVDVELDRVDSWAVMRVSDQGIGIPAADLPRIFERFHRGRNVTGQIAGTGIGLSGAARIVARHGGRIEVESQEGVGSTFTVWLPLR